jgi:hypothetical protein
VAVFTVAPDVAETTIGKTPAEADADAVTFIATVPLAETEG